MSIKEKIEKLNLPSKEEAVGFAIVGLAMYPVGKSITTSAFVAGSIYAVHALLTPTHLNILKYVDKFYDILGNSIEPKY